MAHVQIVKRKEEQKRRESLKQEERKRRGVEDGRSPSPMVVSPSPPPPPKVPQDLCFGSAKPVSCPASYVEFAEKVRTIAEGNVFNYFIIIIIMVAGILVGVQMYEGYDTDPVVVAIDWCVLGIFIVEFVFKVIAEVGRPWRYFTGPEWHWNNFDFIIIFFCLPWPFMTGSTGAIKLLRLLRLMRVVKLVRKVPQLQMIVMGLVGGLTSIGYIMLLLFLVFYIYAILGSVLFGENDPWHFGRLEDGLNSLFRMATLEDWTNIMYINMKGCAAYTDGIYFPVFADKSLPAGSTVVDYNGANQTNYYGAVHNRFPLEKGSLFDGVLCIQVKNCGAMCQNHPGVYNITDRNGISAEAYTDAPKIVNATINPATGAPTWDHVMQIGWSDGINQAGAAAMPIASLVFCVSFIVVSALVMLSLFIGAVTMSMTESMEEMKEQQEKKDKQRRMAKAKKEQQRRREMAKAVSGEVDEVAGVTPTSAKSSVMKSVRGVAKGKGRMKISVAELNQQAKMKSVLLKAWDGTNQPAEVFKDESIESVPWKKKYNRLAMLAKRFADYPLFDKTVTGVILMAGVLVGAQTYDHFAEDACSGTSCDVLQMVMRQGAFLDSLILIVFTVEVVVKICAEAFAPLHYFARYVFLLPNPPSPSATRPS